MKWLAKIFSANNHQSNVIYFRAAGIDLMWLKRTNLSKCRCQATRDTS